MGDIQDAWDAGDPQAPSGFKEWGEAVTEAVEGRQVRLTAEPDSSDGSLIEFDDLPDLASCKVVIHGGHDGGSGWEDVSVRVNDDSSSLYRHSRYRVNGSGTVEGAKSSDGANRWVPCVVGSNSSGILVLELVAMRSGVVSVDASGWQADGSSSSEIVKVHGGGRYTGSGSIASVQVYLSGEDWHSETRAELVYQP